MISIEITRFQSEMLHLYAVDCAMDDLPFTLSRRRLVYGDADATVDAIIEAANSADDGQDAPARDALSRLASRIRRSAT